MAANMLNYYILLKLLELLYDHENCTPPSVYRHVFKLGLQDSRLSPSPFWSSYKKSVRLEKLQIGLRSSISS